MSKKTNKRDYKSMAILAIILIVTVILLILIFKTLFGGTISTSNIDLDKIIKNKETKIVYVENSDSSKCKNCSEIKKYLDSTKISYATYDVNKVKDSEYKDFLNKLYIDSEIFNYPAVIYIREGSMYSNIINIKKTSVIDQFIKDYDLEKVK